MRLLYKLLRQNVSVAQLLAFFVVNLLGGAIVLLGIESYRYVSSIDEEKKEGIATGMAVINKALPADATINSLFGLSPTFSDEEIAEIEALPQIEKVGRFVSAQFEVGAVLSIASARMSTDIFLEAVPDEYIVGNYRPVGNKSIKWEANADSDTLPVIIPQNYLNLYNFGYATSNGLPQISDDIVNTLPLKIVCHTPKGRVVYNAVLCGLTDKFNTILVPMSFVEGANVRFAPYESAAPSRLILKTNASEFSEETIELFNTKGYVIEGDTSALKFQNFIFGLIYMIIGIGAVFSLVAFVLLVMSILLLIEKNKERIAGLYSIGYSIGEIARVYRLLAFAVDFAVWAAAAVVATCVYPHIAGLIKAIVPACGPLPMAGMWLAALLLAVIFALVHAIVIQRNISKHCR